MVEAWFMDESQEDQRKPHRCEPNEPASLEQLRQLGVYYWKMDADNYETDPELAEIRKEKNYSWMDIITIHKDKLPNYEEKTFRSQLRRTSSVEKQPAQPRRSERLRRLLSTEDVLCS